MADPKSAFAGCVAAHNPLTLTIMPDFTSITHDPNVMGGKPCLRGMQVAVGTGVGLVAQGNSHEEMAKRGERTS
jgi:hypothetical protein